MKFEKLFFLLFYFTLLMQININLVICENEKMSNQRQYNSNSKFIHINIINILFIDLIRTKNLYIRILIRMYANGILVKQTKNKFLLQTLD